MPRSPGLHGYLYVVAAASLWGTIGVAFKLGLERGVDYDWLIAGRPLLAGAIAVAVLAAAGVKPSRWSAAIGLAALAPLYVTYPLAVERIGAGMASVLLYTAPIWVVIGGRLLLGERVDRAKAASVALGVGGATLIGVPGGLLAFDPLGLALGLASGLAYAAYMLLARAAQTTGGGGHLQVSLAPLAFAGPATYLAVRPEGVPGVEEAPFILYLAVACTILPYYLHVRGLKHIEAGRVAVVSLLEPVVALLLAASILGESYSEPQVLGSILILASSAIAMGAPSGGSRA